MQRHCKYNSLHFFHPCHDSWYLDITSLFFFVSSHHPCCRSYLHHGKEPRGPPGPKVLRSIPTEWRVPTATGRRRSSQAGHPKEWPGLVLQNGKTHCQRVGELEFYRLSGMAIPGPPTVFNNCLFFFFSSPPRTQMQKSWEFAECVWRLEATILGSFDEFLDDVDFKDCRLCLTFSPSTKHDHRQSTVFFGSRRGIREKRGDAHFTAFWQCSMVSLCGFQTRLEVIMIWKLYVMYVVDDQKLIIQRFCSHRESLGNFSHLSK